MRTRTCAAALTLLAAGPAAAQIYEVAGLRLGMTIQEAELRLSDLSVEAVPYLHPVLGEEYRILTGNLAVLGYEGGVLGARVRVETAFTGAERLFSVAEIVSASPISCAGRLDELGALYGAPIVSEAPSYAMWRQVVVLGPQLEFRCVDPAAGGYQLSLAQPLMQELYLRDLLAELEPVITATLQFFR